MLLFFVCLLLLLFCFLLCFWGAGGCLFGFFNEIRRFKLYRILLVLAVHVFFKTFSLTLQN